MEINKITFDQLAKNAKISENFEELDVNCDGKITKEDAELASINRIKNDIMSILNEADKDPVPINQKTSASTSSSIRCSTPGRGISPPWSWPVPWWPR